MENNMLVVAMLIVALVLEFKYLPSARAVLSALTQSVSSNNVQALKSVRMNTYLAVMLAVGIQVYSIVKMTLAMI